MHIVVAYQTPPADVSALSASVFNLANGTVFSPKAGAFVADAGADGLVPLTRSADANHKSFVCGVIADVPPPGEKDAYSVTVHLATGGEALTRIPFSPPEPQDVRVSVAFGVK